MKEPTLNFQLKNGKQGHRYVYRKKCLTQRTDKNLHQKTKVLENTKKKKKPWSHSCQDTKQELWPNADHNHYLNIHQLLVLPSPWIFLRSIPGQILQEGVYSTVIRHFLAYSHLRLVFVTCSWIWSSLSPTFFPPIMATILKQGNLQHALC